VSRRSNGEGTIYRRSDGRYEAAAFVHVADGSRKRVRLYAATRAEAQRRLTEQLRLQQQYIPAAATNQTVAAFMDHWVRDIVPKKTRPNTIRMYESLSRLYIKPLLGRKLLTRLSVRDVQSAIDSLQADGHSARTIQKVRTTLRAALHQAMREELIFRNVASLVQLPTWVRKPIHPWTVEEASAFLDATEGHRLHIAFRLLLTYGMREGEVLGLRWNDIDFEAGVFHIRQQIQRLDGKLRAVPVKTAAGQRTLPLVPSVRNILLDLAKRRGISLIHVPGTDDERTTEGLVVTSTTGGPIEGQNFLRSFRRLAEGAGLRIITVHHMRHTAATMLGSLGVPPRDVQLILGHANISTTQQIYQHGSPEIQRLAVSAVDHALSSGSHPVSEVSPSDGSRCRQELPSKDSKPIKGEETQEPPRMIPTGVTASDSLGGSSQTRTGDTRLFSPVPDTLHALPTPIVRNLLDRTRSWALGRVAVNCCRQMTALDDQLRGTLLFRRQLQAMLVTHLRRRSFPLNLLATTPLNAPQEAS